MSEQIGTARIRNGSHCCDQRGGSKLYKPILMIGAMIYAPLWLTQSSPLFLCSGFQSSPCPSKKKSIVVAEPMICWVGTSKPTTPQQLPTAKQHSDSYIVHLESPLKPPHKHAHTHTYIILYIYINKHRYTHRYINIYRVSYITILNHSCIANQSWEIPPKSPNNNQQQKPHHITPIRSFAPFPPTAACRPLRGPRNAARCRLGPRTAMWKWKSWMLVASRIFQAI